MVTGDISPTIRMRPEAVPCLLPIRIRISSSTHENGSVDYIEVRDLEAGCFDFRIDAGDDMLRTERRLEIRFAPTAPIAPSQFEYRGRRTR